MVYERVLVNSRYSMTSKILVRVAIRFVCLLITYGVLLPISVVVSNTHIIPPPPSAGMAVLSSWMTF
jgi:hypothetical protein